MFTFQASPQYSMTPDPRNNGVLTVAKPTSTVGVTDTKPKIERPETPREIALLSSRAVIR
jgi:hypothetical protein